MDEREEADIEQDNAGGGRGGIGAGPAGTGSHRAPGSGC